MSVFATLYKDMQRHCPAVEILTRIEPEHRRYNLSFIPLYVDMEGVHIHAQ